MKFRSLVIVLPIERIMKESVRMVLQSIYYPEDTSRSLALNHIKEKWGTSRWFLEFDIRNHTIDQERLIQVIKELIDNPKFFYCFQCDFAHSVLLSPLFVNIYLHKLDQEIVRIREKYEIPLVQRMRLVGSRDAQDEGSKGVIRVDRSMQPVFHSLLSFSPGTFGFRVGFQHSPIAAKASSALAVFKPSSLLTDAFLIARWKDPFYRWALSKTNGVVTERGVPLIELRGEARLVSGSDRSISKQPPTQYLTRISYVRYDSHLLLGITGDVDFRIETQRRISHFLEYALNLGAGNPTYRSTIAARMEFFGMIICEQIPGTTHIQFLRELEKRLRVKQRIHLTASHLRTTIQTKFRNLGVTIPTNGTSPSTLLPRSWMVDSHISGKQAVSRSHTHHSTAAPLLRSGSTIRIEAPMKKILRRLRDRGIISRRRPCPIHVACLTNVSDEDIVNWFAGIAISLLSYYRCRDNLYQVRIIVDHQIRWSAIFTLAHKHKISARRIILKYSKDLKIVHQSAGQILAEFPNSIELGKLRP